MKINIFRGDLTDISAKKEALEVTMKYHKLCNGIQGMKHPQSYGWNRATDTFPGGFRIDIVITLFLTGYASNQCFCFSKHVKSIDQICLNVACTEIQSNCMKVNYNK